MSKEDFQNLINEIQSSIIEPKPKEDILEQGNEIIQAISNKLADKYHKEKSSNIDTIYNLNYKRAKLDEKNHQLQEDYENISKKIHKYHIEFSNSNNTKEKSKELKKLIKENNGIRTKIKKEITQNKKDIKDIQRTRKELEKKNKVIKTTVEKIQPPLKPATPGRQGKLRAILEQRGEKEFLKELEKYKESHSFNDMMYNNYLNMLEAYKRNKEKKKLEKPKVKKVVESFDVVSSKLQQLLFKTSVKDIKQALINLNFKGRLQTQKILLVQQLLQNFNTVEMMKKLISAIDPTLTGSGIFDWISDTTLSSYNFLKDKVSDVINSISTISDFSVNTKRNLEKYGNKPITKLTIYRKPIQEWINKVFNGLSRNKWDDAKKKYGVDKFFHLTLVCEIEGKNVSCEKLEVVSVNENVPSGEGVEIQPVNMRQKQNTFTINMMFDKTRKTVGDSRFFSYSALGKNNCQDFVAMLLKSVDLYGKEEEDFTYQNIVEMVDELPDHLKTFSQATTNLGAIFNKYTGIGGEKPDSDYPLHAVIFKKPYNLDTAKQEAKNIIKDKKKNFYRETKTSYRFRAIPKTKFEKKSFRTKKINNNISLIFGKLK